ncbi:MAG: ribose ABC transporter permease [Acidobacteria bacterium]|nr:MAG: ribose ABC transporter permease [Acidobacteriota bacterium]
MPAVIVGLAIVFGAINPNFWSVTNLANVSRQMSILALLALGQTFAILSGGIDLSVGSLLALVSVVCAQRMKEFGLAFGIGAGVLAGGFAGLVNGLIIARARVPAFIATLGMLVAARGAALVLSGGLPIAGLPREFLTLGAGYLGPFPIPTVIAIVAFALAHVILSRTRFGRYVYAMGSNEEAAVLSGINVAKYKMLVYITSGLFAGVAGVILTARVISGQPTLGEVQELYSIAAVVIGGGRISGGVGGVWTTLMGVLVLGILGNGLNLVQVSSYIQNIVIGAIIVGAVWIDLARERRQ